MRRASNRMKKKYTDLGLDVGERKRRASRLPCLSIGLGDDRRDMSGSGDGSLTIFITSVSACESLTSVTNRFFQLSGPPGLKLAFDAAKRN